MRAFAKLPAAVTGHPFFHEQPFDRGHALADIAAFAAHAPHSISIKGHIIDLEAGDFPGSIRFFAKRWGWSKSKVDRFFTQIEADGLVIKKRDGTRDTNLSVWNLVIPASYTTSNEAERDAKRDARGTLAGRSRDIAVEVIEGKEGERTPLLAAEPLEGDSTTSSPSSEKARGRARSKGVVVDLVVSDDFHRFWSLYPRKAARARALEVWRRLNPTPELVERIIQAVRDRAKGPQWTREAGRFIPHPSTWLGRQQWADEPTEVAPTMFTSKTAGNAQVVENALRYSESQR